MPTSYSDVSVCLPTSKQAQLYQVRTTLWVSGVSADRWTALQSRSKVKSQSRPLIPHLHPPVLESPITPSRHQEIYRDGVNIFLVYFSVPPYPTPPL